MPIATGKLSKNAYFVFTSGGYAGMTKNLLVSLGWNKDKIYNVGGYWFYEGNHNIEVERKLPDGKVIYDFYKVPYHQIDFTKLTKNNHD